MFVTAVSQERLYYCLVGKLRFEKLRTLSEVRQPEVAQAGIRIQKSLVPEARVDSHLEQVRAGLDA